jgi:hypothetical protein
VGAADAEAAVDLLEHVQQVVDLLEGVGRGELDPEADLRARHHRVGGHGDVDPPVEQVPSDGVHVRRVGQGQLGQRHAGGVGGGDAELVQVVEDGPGAVPELDAEVVATTPVGLKAEQGQAPSGPSPRRHRRPRRGHRGHGGMQCRGAAAEREHDEADVDRASGPERPLQGDHPVAGVGGEQGHHRQPEQPVGGRPLAATTPQAHQHGQEGDVGQREEDGGQPRGRS